MDFEDSSYEMGEENVEEEIDDKEEEGSEREEEAGFMEREVIEVEDKAQDAKPEDTQAHFLKSRITFFQFQMKDMEKTITTSMKVIDGLMRCRMVGVVTDQSKIKRKMEKLWKQEEKKDMTHVAGLDQREYVSQIGENWKLIAKAK